MTPPIDRAALRELVRTAMIADHVTPDLMVLGRRMREILPQIPALLDQLDAVEAELAQTGNAMSEKIDQNYQLGLAVIELNNRAVAAESERDAAREVRAITENSRRLAEEE